MEYLGFIILSLICVWSAIMMITARKVAFSVFWLLVSFFATACIFLLLNAEFLAVVQILVNAGAVVISFLFVVILINLREEPRAERYHKQSAFAIGTMALLFLSLGLYLIPRGNYLRRSGEALALKTAQWGGNSEIIGKYLFTDYILPFEIIAIVLLVAIVGVVVLGKKNNRKKAD